MSPDFVLIAFGAFTTLVLPGIQGQIVPNELPVKLQYLVKWDLERWRAPNEIEDNFPYYLSGFDFENRPIWIVEFGKWDIATLLNTGAGDDASEQALSKHIDQGVWRAYNSTGMRATKGKPVKEVICIVDMDGYDRRQINSAKAVAFIIKKMRTIHGALQFAHDTFVLNASVAAHSLLSVLRPILGRGVEKIHLFGTNPDKFKPVLLKHIPNDQIAEGFGGVAGFQPVKKYG
ncbi:unnamed protein product [Allacma fusca]|uniref:CRAL-TRIO domain-containing protein n=1 Tax=Allacma fusca TaxID=39272 RepID=A0A8J2JAY6_9HEXA|nr:unnamed protein product [Allacma fusca]